LRVSVFAPEEFSIVSEVGFSLFGRLVLGAAGAGSAIVPEFTVFFFGGAIVGCCRAENTVGISVGIRKIFFLNKKVENDVRNRIRHKIDQTQRRHGFNVENPSNTKGKNYGRRPANNLTNNGNSKFFFLQDQATERKRNLQSRGVAASIHSLLSPSLIHVMTSEKYSSSSSYVSSIWGWAPPIILLTWKKEKVRREYYVFLKS
jgi:hypothetical protein